MYWQIFFGIVLWLTWQNPIAFCLGKFFHLDQWHFCHICSLWHSCVSIVFQWQNAWYSLVHPICLHQWHHIQHEYIQWHQWLWSQHRVDWEAPHSKGHRPNLWVRDNQLELVLWKEIIIYCVKRYVIGILDRVGWHEMDGSKEKKKIADLR